MWKGGVGFTIAHRTTTWTTRFDRLDLGENRAGRFEGGGFGREERSDVVDL
jgi:hypothetical protein